MTYNKSIAQLLCLGLEETMIGDNMSEIEQELRRQMIAIGREALEIYLNKQEAKYPSRTTTCLYCASEAEYVRCRGSRLHTMLGEIRYKRAYYLCPSCHQGHSPLDQALGLRPNQMSAEKERLGGMMGVETSFGKGSELFGEMTLVNLSNHSLDKAAQAYGQEMEQVEQEWLEEAFDTEKLRQRRQEARQPIRLYGSIDATKVHIRGEKEHPWRDLKIGAWYEARGNPPRKPDGEWQIRAENISYYSDICPASEFGPLLWATGVQQNAHLAQELIFLADGAEWIWNLVGEHFPKAIQIVDWFHACEYLMPVAKVAFRQPAQRDAWVSKVKTDLWHSRLDAVIAACAVLVDPQRDDDPAQKAVTYFHNNRQRMDYAAYRKNGYQIGSGTIESAAKQIGSQRMKVPGAIWSFDGARYVAKARSAYLSGQWPLLAQRRHFLPLCV